MIMAPRKSSIAAMACCVVLLLAGAAQASTAATQQDAHTVGAGTMVLRLPAELGEPQRPPVVFDHAEHVEELEEEGCTACHGTGEDGRLIPRLGTRKQQSNAKRFRNLFHDTCIGCHEQREDGGRSDKCAECHKTGPIALPAREPMAFDYSLHHRHIAALDKKCEACHHIYDEQAHKLVYKKGEENACNTCHEEKPEGDKPSLKDASHSSCVACHLARKTKELSAGPVLCAGCHDSESQAKIATLPAVPRLMRGQKDLVWIDAPGSKCRKVAFDHKAHENNAKFCTTCHNGTPQRCSECHGDDGEATLAQAYHTPDNVQSCVGCHEKQTERKDCAGCHGSMPREVPSESSCSTCHAGPVPGTSPLPPIVKKVSLAALPAASDSFPETVIIDELMNLYEPSEMPHRKIVAHLDALVRKDGLATRFHGQTETLCAGCHHHSPVGERPPACSACHNEEMSGATDKPALRAAYHRQCVGCHQRMDIEEQSCTACHAKMPEEVRK